MLKSFKDLVLKKTIKNFRFFSHSKYVLPNLSFDYQALEPYLSGDLIELHYNQHHRAYVTNLNKTVEKYYEENESSLDSFINRLNLLTSIKFFAGGHINHSLYWENLLPNKQGGGQIINGPLVEAIKKEWKSVDEFIRIFNMQLAGIQGSGWAWLVKSPFSQRLSIQTTMNQDVVTQGKVILGIDAWEHSYYIQYLNNKTKYFENIWNVVNWKVMNQRFEQ
ncbi:hypothetical protein PNEG_01707 [Pneumocystis murina B123]|uniref:Superoxide dismutase n=2 Tax=Pneumocystis murina TaxID=263815 RepID=M7PHL4_PNEMU|nr:hypothetical protein PNEG_01707 [Pneumocystis murina B123]EMR09949.1 hypothetical protein PNEG_01707 [Pneumocystis murina B123]